MSKDKFNRSNVKSSILKKVIIRIDFIGLTDIVGCVNILKPIMQGKFNKFMPIDNNNYNVELPGINHTKELNVNYEKKTFYQFSDSQIGKSNANFMIGTDFAYIEVNCDKDYEGCDDYIKLMAASIYQILQFDAFISVRRLGLRKIDVEVFKNECEMDSSLEDPIWNNYKRSQAYLPLKKSYSDILLQKDVNTVFHIQRAIQGINDNQYQYTFDIDSYKSGDLICKDDFSSVQRIEKTISGQMNEPVFNYFIDTFTERYIDDFYNA